ncbi:MAG: hypothetical protein O3A82_07915 [Verrucomicrobia bacterium]|nr:hypothetical protein [Verrucomicrobiota bacterium]MDA1046838.1 hypothetical protein [Verrucomicrobiota bacterium]
MPEFLNILRREARLVAFSRMAVALAAAFVTWPGLALLLDAYDAAFPILESQAVKYVFVALGVTALVFLLLAWRAWAARPNPEQVAIEVEKGNPQLMDLLNCAVDLHDREREEYTFMERRVLEKAEQRAETISWERGARPGGRFWSAVVAGLLAGSLLTAWSFERSPLQKTFDSLLDEPGLSVFTTKTGETRAKEHPASYEFSRGTDISVFADVTRGHRGKKNAFIEFEENGKVERLEMLETTTLGRFEYVVPGLAEPFVYRIVTLSIEGNWQKLNPYDPPVLEEARWDIIPPSYSGLVAFEQVGFGHRRVPEGSRIELSLQVAATPPHVVAHILSEANSSNELARNDEGFFELNRVLRKDWSGRLALKDSDFPQRDAVEYEEFVFSVIPDKPPVVEITEPAKDLEVPSDGQLLLEIFAADDYGVAKAEVIVSHGGKKEAVNVFPDPVEREKTLSHIIDLSELSLAVGDVVSYHAIVTDNKEPEGQQARSEIYFIEILPPEGEEIEGDGGDMAAEQKEIPIRDFINQTKQIIRSTYDALGEEGEERDRRAIAISADALGLKHGMTKVYDENDGEFPSVDGIDLGELLNEATFHIEQTEIFAGDNELEKSLEPSEETLRKLVLMYALIRKEQKMKSKGKGKKGDKQEETAEKQEPSEEQGEPSDPAEELKKLGEALEQARDLQERQNELNSKIGRASRNGRKGEPNRELAKEQDEIQEDTEGLRDDVYGKSGRIGDVRSFDRAGEEMQDSKGELSKDDPQKAKPHGDLAAEALSDAISEIEGKMSAIAADMLGQLESQGKGLAKRQRENAEKTEGAGAGSGEPLKGEQDGINEEAKDLLSKIEQAGMALRDLSENATEDLFRSAREARGKGIEKSGKRASNALLYEAFPQAKREEDKVAGELEDVAEDLADVKRKLQNQGNAALAELAKKLRETQQQLPGMGDEQLKERSDELAKAIGNLPGGESDERVRNLTQFFEQVAIDENPSQARSAASEAVAQALELVEQFFWKEAVEERLRRNHETTAAPRKYKRQVEEYFRRIAEGN